MNRNEFLKKKVEAEDTSLSRAFREIGQFISIGLADGINKMDIKSREWALYGESRASQEAKGG